jgi:VWFA-related protein
VRGLITLLIFLGASLGSANQQEQPRFRSGVQVVEVDVRVFDRDGRFVADLSREDFELIEDRVPQRIQELFLVQPAGGSVTAGAAESGGVRAAAPPATTARHTWIFHFDLNHLTPGAGFDRARKAVEEFIRERFKDGDLAGVVAGTTMVNNRLTSVREELLSAVKSVRPLVERRRVVVEMTREWPRLLNEWEVALVARDDREARQRAVTRACSDDPTSCDRAEVEVRSKAQRLHPALLQFSTQTLNSVNALASGLARMPGPKTIVFLSDGFITENIETSLRTVVGQAARAGARVYAIDVRGLDRTGGSIIDQAQVADEAGAPAQFDMAADGPNSLAVDTGGMVIRNENNIGRALDAIAQDTNRYYVLAYQPSHGNFDGKFRSIEVRVKRPGVRVRARRGYLALEPSKMLLPQPVKRTQQDEAAADAAAAATGPPALAPPDGPPPGTIATGTVVGRPATASTAVPRLRPDAADQIEALAGSDTATAGDLARRGWEAYQRGDVETAMPLFTEAAAQGNPRPWILYALGLSQVALGRPADAVVSWEHVRQQAPEFDAVYMDLADAYVQLGQISPALAVLRDAEKRWPQEADVHNAIGVIHVRRGAIDEAIAAFTRAAEAAPGEALGHLNLGRAYELRYERGRRYVTSQRRWVAPDDDRRQARKAYERCVALGGPYAAHAADALSRLDWSK